MELKHTNSNVEIVLRSTLNHEELFFKVKNALKNKSYKLFFQEDALDCP